MNSFAEVHLPWWQWVLLAALLLTQGTWLFLDARRRGARSWFWGLWGVIQCPMPLLVYWLLVRHRPRCGRWRSGY